MAEELQHLIERIQREAVDTGEQQAAKIVAQAREKAAALVKEAEAKAAALLERAEAEARLYSQRGEQALAQAGRDLLISVGRGVERIFEQLVDRSADQLLEARVLQPALARILEAYVKDGGHARNLEVLVGEADRASLEEFFRQRFSAELADGLKIIVDARTGKGFKVRLRDRHVEHDFSREAIAEALSSLLRPALAETVAKASRGS